MRTAAQLNTLLSPYLATADGLSAATSILPMLNQVLPKLYSLGDWRALKTEYSADVTAGQITLPPDYECILSARVKDIPVEINPIDYEYGTTGQGLLERPVSFVFGLVDKGMVPVMSDSPDDGIEELIFTCATADFASGDTVKIEYTDSEDGYTAVTLPLNAIALTISGASDGSGGLTTLTMTSTTGLVVGLGITITPADLSGDSEYIGTFRIEEVTDATNVKIVKAWTDSMTGTAIGAATLMPANTIDSVESMVYTSLPGRTLVKDDDGVIYANLPAGDGAASFRRYEVLQVPEEAVAADEWTVDCVVKRAFIPLTATSDIVYLDSIHALKHGFIAVTLEDKGDLTRSEAHWELARKILDKELHDHRGGINERPKVEIWGNMVAPMPSYY
jgi:hypothetical protein